MEDLQTNNNGGGNTNRDRISVLPDELIHQIMSHLDTREVVHTSILSNRWRYIWLSTPYLAFDIDYWLKKCQLCSLETKKDAFMDFVETVLTSRGGSHSRGNAFKFSLCSQTHHLDPSRLSLWINMCLERDVKHLCLYFDCFRIRDIQSRPIVLPTNIVCQTSGIRILHLTGLALPAGNAKGGLVLSGSVLEELEIWNCDINHLNTLTIFTPSLEILRLTLYTDREDASNVNVKIYTPKLHKLGLSTWSSEHFSAVCYSIEEDLKSLVTAYIYIIKVGCAQYFDVMDGCSQSLIKILSRIYNAQNLYLYICTKQVLTDFPVLLEKHPYKFQNLRRISLMDKIRTPCIRAMLKFLASFPGIETLVWNKRLDREVNEEEESVASELEQSFSNLSLGGVCICLKTVEFWNVEGTEVEIKFLGFLVERAFLLEKLIIKYNKLLSRDKLEEFKKKVLSLAEATSNASISFLLAIDLC